VSYIVRSVFLNQDLTQTSNNTYQDLTTSFGVVLGSEITYEPRASLGQEVIYEYNTIWTYKDNTSKIIFRLTEYNTETSSWDVINGSYVTLKSLRQGTCPINYKYIFEKWSGNKQLRLECKDSSTSLEGYLHTDYYQTHFFNPAVSCSTI
tara:strand:+ start:95 stop:544 length:450 start_codon:yes stop_codon:yes gene_type:complete